MTERRKLDINIGLRSMRAPKYASDPAYFADMRNISQGLMKAMHDIIRQFEDVTPSIIADALQPTLEKSKMYCPEDTGALRASAYLDVANFRSNERVEIGYARSNIPDYAIVVHENLEMQHKPPTQAKFLERAVNEDMGLFYGRLADGYARFMGV